MSYDLNYDQTQPLDRVARYRQMAVDWASLFDPNAGWTANAANFCALLVAGFGWWWVGFYRVRRGDQTLVLGPFQGTVACTTIPKGKGVCGTAWERDEPLMVPDVDQFSGHIACSSLSRSELVIPLHSMGEVVAVLDLDSVEINDFGHEDIEALIPMLQLLQSAWTTSSGEEFPD
ncbi:MAG: GAF domain-containing protein [Sphingomonadales bacterium]|nr:GAF domain-containing protein [Sphingomonadales bacterium]